MTDTVLARVAALKDMPTPALTRYGYNQAYRCRRLRRRSPGPGYSGVVAAPSLPMNEANVPSRGEIGYVERNNLAVEYRWADGHYERLPALVADLLSRHISVIAANAPAAVAAKAATTTVPIVFVTAADPVKIGLVESLNRPGGNLTSVSLLSVELAAKKLQMLHELVPNVRTVALLVNSSNRNAETQSRDLRGAAQALGLQLHILHANSERDFDVAFAALAQLKVGALVIGTDGFLNSRTEQLAALYSASRDTRGLTSGANRDS